MSKLQDGLGRVIFAREEFKGQHLLLNGCNMQRCTFRGCLLELWKPNLDHKLPARRLGANVHLCKFLEGTTFAGDGWPRRGAVGWLSGMPE